MKDYIDSGCRGCKSCCAAQAGHSSAGEHRKCLSPPRRWRNSVELDLSFISLSQRMHEELHFQPNQNFSDQLVVVTKLALPKHASQYFYRFVKTNAVGTTFKLRSCRFESCWRTGSIPYRHSGTGKRACLNIFVVRQFKFVFYKSFHFDVRMHG